MSAELKDRDKICPVCIEIMQKETRNTGSCKGKRIHYVCPKCGYQFMQSSEKCRIQNEIELYQKMKRINLETNIEEL
ncbi:MAG: DUF2225 domain-containing protein [Melioribacteraceae bacterium]|jgi:predicted RNA-binding Zn-ribbon protein involved in translation (DUF1610 family)|nr:DUF2225 domain-containing protein [Melioribacteraceae bacterium]